MNKQYMQPATRTIHLCEEAMIATSPGSYSNSEGDGVWCSHKKDYEESRHSIWDGMDGEVSP